MSITFGFGLSAVVSLVGVMTRALTPAGGVTAALVGTAIIVGTGWPGALALGAFFVSSSVVSRLTEADQPHWVDTRGNRRDSIQVLANGGVAAAGGILGSLVDPGAGLWVAVSALAAAGADTWATSIGALSRGDPMHLWRGTRVPKGTSGGVSLIGTAGGAAGSLLVSLAPLAAGGPIRLLPAASLIGLLGMVADSFLGATVQGRFTCPVCGQPSERQRHRCGIRTRHAGGWLWLGNDGVNLLATLLAGGAGWAWWACSR